MEKDRFRLVAGGERRGMSSREPLDAIERSAMDWMLTDEEIKGIEGSMWPSGYAVAQAQAKKLVEWLEVKGTLLANNSNNAMLGIPWDEVWQELRRQVGLE